MKGVSSVVGRRRRSARACNRQTTTSSIHFDFVFRYRYRHVIHFDFVFRCRNGNSGSGEFGARSAIRCWRAISRVRGKIMRDDDSICFFLKVFDLRWIVDCSTKIVSSTSNKYHFSTIFKIMIIISQKQLDDITSTTRFEARRRIGWHSTRFVVLICRIIQIDNIILTIL